MFEDEQVFTKGRDEGSFQAKGITYNEKKSRVYNQSRNLVLKFSFTLKLPRENFLKVIPGSHHEKL